MPGILNEPLPRAELPSMPINPEWILEGSPAAAGQVLMQTDDKLISYGVWECTSGKFQWIFDCDEFIHVQEGEATIREEGGRTVTLRRGDLAHFPRGLKTYWHVPHYIRKVFTLRTLEPL